MKKRFLTLAAALSAAFVVSAQDLPDSLRVEQLQEVVVSAVRAAKDAPFAVSNISQTALKDFSSTGKELPALFARTPGVLAWSENGVGTGTSYLRIRGAGGSRINVTLDGVPLNSPEDQTVFWANMNSYASLLGSVQIQRGVGTSTNGDGAFGGTIALGTRAPSLLPTLEVSGAYGSWNTWRAGGRFSSGLLGNHFILEGAWHQTATDGYVHGTSGTSGSYLAALTWLGIDCTLSYKLLGNYENTGQAWNGVTSGNDGYSLNAYDGLKTYKDLCDAGLGQYNSLYEILPGASNYTVLHNEDGSYLVERYHLAEDVLWPRTTDNFWQNHHLLSFAWDISSAWKLSAVAHNTHGYGYYEEFRYDNKLIKYGLSNFTDKGGSVVKKSDFVRQKGLSQNTLGLVGSLRYRDGVYDAVAGVSLQRFSGNHFGYLTYVSDGLASDILADGPYKYYDSDAVKGDYSAFVKISRAFGAGWEVFSDLQYRHVDYTTDGVNDKFIKQDDGTYRNQVLDINKHYDFLNPKLGLSWRRKDFRAYASAAIAHREPERNNFTDNGAYPAPEPEKVLDIETGWQYSAGRFRASQNIYWMDYSNQFVQTGAKSDIGENLTTNIKSSYRLGTEISAAYELLPCLSVEGNAALSRNRILDFDEVVENWEGDALTVHYDNSTTSSKSRMRFRLKAAFPSMLRHGSSSYAAEISVPRR